MMQTSQINQSAPAKRKRLHSFDLARSFAVFIMVIGHCINAYNDGAHMRLPALQLLQRAAPALFIIIFGLFLQIVYAKSMRHNGFSSSAKKLFSRAIQCYSLYVLSCIILAISENYSIAYTIRMSLLLGATPYTDILKYYALTLLIAPFLLYLKQAYGYTPIIVFCIITHGLHYAFYPEPIIGNFPGSVIIGSNPLRGIRHYCRPLANTWHQLHNHRYVYRRTHRKPS